MPSDRLYAMYDSGAFALLSELTMVNLNGLISDEQTMLDAKNRHFNKILQRFDPDYLVAYLNDDQVADVPTSALFHKADHRVSRGYHKGHRLCIVDPRIYSPFEN